MTATHTAILPSCNNKNNRFIKETSITSTAAYLSKHGFHNYTSFNYMYKLYSQSDISESICSSIYALPIVIIYAILFQQTDLGLIWQGGSSAVNIYN